MATQETAKTQYTTAENGITFAYRRLGPTKGTPLVMEIHYRANMDFWDPLLVNNIAAERPVIIYDRAGIGRSDGEVPPTCRGWAEHAVAFVQSLGLEQIDLLGFSMGGYTVQMVALNAPHLIRKLIIAGSGPSETSSTPSGIVWPRDPQPPRPIKLLSTADNKEDMETSLEVSFFPESELGRKAARAYFSRIYTRTPETSGEPSIHAFLDLEKTKIQREAAIDWTIPNPRNSFDRLGELKMPVLIVNGDDDVLIPTSRSYELLKYIENAHLIIYPQSGHGFLWQYPERVAADINAFLDHDLQSMYAKL